MQGGFQPQEKWIFQTPNSCSGGKKKKKKCFNGEWFFY